MMNGKSTRSAIAAGLVMSMALASGEGWAFRGMARTSIHPMGGNFAGAQVSRPGFNGGGEQFHGGQPGPRPQPGPGPTPNPNPHPPGPPPGPGPAPHPPGPPPGPGPHPPPPPAPPYWGGGWYVDPVAAAVTVGVTAAVVGSMIATLPPSCTSIVIDGATYEQCGSTWYQPQYVGTQVQYVVVKAPR
ncbi:DUF6515 family protein [Paraburkholderia sp. J67]|uniref:DUF6515 family protein n=1 Tax=Paraburkholderia sp. J67 TaxID=2805435 RepID=UPI002ABD4A40|nr:DUF6515 family protein [Paraburkholderia sp. J67]